MRLTLGAACGRRSVHVEVLVKTTMIVGLGLVLAGIGLFVLQASGVFVERAAIDIAGAELGVEAQRNLPWLPWVAGGSAVVGSVLQHGQRSQAGVPWRG